MPRCHLTVSFVKSLNQSRPDKRIMFMDTDFRSLTLEIRPSGAGTWYFRYKESGTFKLYRLGALDELNVLEAKAQVVKLQEAMRSGGLRSMAHEHRAQRQTFADFIREHYLPHAKSRKRSWQAEQGMFRRDILPVLGEMRMDSINRLTLTHWQDGMREKGLAASTCNRSLYLLKYVFNCARRWGVIAESPARDVQALPEKEFRERYLSEEEARRLLDALDEEKDQAAHVIRLLLFTGARKSEILAARWENVDLERCTLTVPLSKSGKARHIPLSDAALQVLAELPRCSAWLFPSARTTGHITSIFSVWDRVRTQAGLKDVRLHDLRHSFASFLVNSGCSLYEVQKILGHHNPKVTTRYAHLSQDSLLKAANIVSKKIGIRKKKKHSSRIPVNKIK